MFFKEFTIQAIALSLKDMWESEDFFDALIVTFAIMFIVSMIVVGVKKAEESTLPSEYMSNVKVIEKNACPHQLNSSEIIYSVTFEDENGKRICLNTPREEYNVLIQGDVVNVTHRAGKLLSFSRNPK